MSARANGADPSQEIPVLLGGFNLTTMAEVFVAKMNEAGFSEALAVVHQTLLLEADARRERRVSRLRRAAQLPPGKRYDTFDFKRLPAPLAQQIRDLGNGDFLDRAVNVLAFGLPGVGKSHAACAIGHALVERGHSVLFRPTYQLVQELLAAKRELSLPRLLRKLDHFELLVLDDIGYIQQNADEAEVLFTLISERYERRSLLITSNLVFSDWERIFPSAMATLAAIDRLVHHSVILEFPGPSIRNEQSSNSGVPVPRPRRGKRP
jgi:DNA replication protein DnaC